MHLGVRRQRRYTEIHIPLPLQPVKLGAAYPKSHKSTAAGGGKISSNRLIFQLVIIFCDKFY
jgi:hypothetical protein